MSHQYRFKVSVGKLTVPLNYKYPKRQNPKTLRRTSQNKGGWGLTVYSLRRRIQPNCSRMNCSCKSCNHLSTVKNTFIMYLFQYKLHQVLESGLKCWTLFSDDHLKSLCLYGNSLQEGWDRPQAMLFSLHKDDGLITALKIAFLD